MNRKELLKEIALGLGDRRLIWAGIRGDDVEGITDLPNLDAAFSIIGRYDRRRSVEGVVLEDLTGRVVDLEAWDIDDHLHTESAVVFRKALLRTLSRKVHFSLTDPLGFCRLYGSHVGIVV